MNGRDDLPEWELLLRAAARLQRILPDATLVGGTAAALVAGHRRSADADHVLPGLAGRFDDVLAPFELDDVEPRMADYKRIGPRWRSWSAVVKRCQALGVELAEAVANRRQGWTDVGPAR